MRMKYKFLRMLFLKMKLYNNVIKQRQLMKIKMLIIKKIKKVKRMRDI